MYVCSCNVITALEIKRAIIELLKADPLRVITPGSVYRSMGYRPRCGSCLPHVSMLIAAAEETGAHLVLEDDYSLAESA